MSEVLAGNKVDKMMHPVDVSEPLSILVQWAHEYSTYVSMIYCDVTNPHQNLGD